MKTISCLSQKGGVGKSTLARLIAQAYASAEWRVKIADFNTKQLTSAEWAGLRLAAEIKPEIPAEAFGNVRKALNQGTHYDLMVFDGRPDSDATSLEIAKESDLIILPAGVSRDDLSPQVKFAHELLTRGIDRRRILFVINKTLDSTASISDARAYVEAAGYAVASNDLPSKTGYQQAQNQGRSVAESAFATLNERASAIATEIAAKLTLLENAKALA